MPIPAIGMDCRHCRLDTLTIAIALSSNPAIVSVDEAAVGEVLVITMIGAGGVVEVISMTVLVGEAVDEVILMTAVIEVEEDAVEWGGSAVELSTTVEEVEDEGRGAAEDSTRIEEGISTAAAAEVEEDVAE
mmetsp:Transcript_24390/g.51497  ORF Transcript_24390/g.51497 Transcript_24390/m.51497 type:complete len:132 (-) Transcript_24390:3308-3703(-)